MARLRADDGKLYGILHPIAVAHGRSFVKYDESQLVQEAKFDLEALTKESAVLALTAMLEGGESKPYTRNGIANCMDKPFDSLAQACYRHAFFLFRKYHFYLWAF